MKIEKLIYGGFGLGRKESGTPVFVYKSVPGDEVETSTVESKKSFEKGIIKTLVTPSKDRIDAICPHFAKCGGCEHQNMEYKDQLHWKNEIFIETLERAKIAVKPLPIIQGGKNELYYRNVMRYSMKCNAENLIEYQMHNYLYNKENVAIKKCFLLSKTSNKIMDEIKTIINENIEDKSTFWQLRIREGKNTNECMVEIMTDEAELPQKKLFLNKLIRIREVKSIYHTYSHSRELNKLTRKLLYGPPVITEKVGSFTFKISPESFFQTNSLGIKTLYDNIKSFAGIDAADNVLDLYCGTGSIGIYLSTLAKKVFGVDSEASAINDARGNCQANHIHNCEFMADDAEKYLKKNKSKFDIAIVDPPRSGLNESIIQMLCELEAKRVVYVSCNPTTFARDIKLFEARGWALQKVQPIDMFPQTHHIECVGLLSK